MTEMRPAPSEEEVMPASAHPSSPAIPPAAPSARAVPAAPSAPQPTSFSRHPQTLLIPAEPVQPAAYVQPAAQSFANNPISTPKTRVQPAAHTNPLTLPTSFSRRHGAKTLPIPRELRATHCATHPVAQSFPPPPLPPRPSPPSPPRPPPCPATLVLLSPSGYKLPF